MECIHSYTTILYSFIAIDIYNSPISIGVENAEISFHLSLSWLHAVGLGRECCVLEMILLIPFQQISGKNISMMLLEKHRHGVQFVLSAEKANQ